MDEQSRLLRGGGVLRVLRIVARTGDGREVVAVAAGAPLRRRRRLPVFVPPLLIGADEAEQAQRCSGLYSDLVWQSTSAPQRSAAQRSRNTAASMQPRHAAWSSGVSPFIVVFTSKGRPAS